MGEVVKVKSQSLPSNSDFVKAHREIDCAITFSSIVVLKFCTVANKVELVIFNH